METKAKQSYDEQPNPPTTEENVRLQSLAAANTLWACLAREVAYGENDSETSVADKIEAVEATIAGKANTSHTHTYGDISGLSVVASTGSYSSLSGTPDLAEVATSGDYNDLTNKPAEYVHPATHPASMITGLSDVATSGSYTDLTDKPTIPIVPTSLPADGGNADTVDNKHASDFATANHTHTQYASTAHTHEISDVTGLAGELDGKAAATHTHSNYAAKTHTHTLADISETTEKKVMTAAERTKLNGIATGANNYSHPATHPASIITGLAEVATSGSYDDLTDKPTSMSPTAHTHAQSDIIGLATALSGKASTEHTHAQDDITGLADALAGKASSSHTHGAATTTANGMMSAADKAKLDGIATGANKTVVDSAMSATSTNPVQNKVINTALSGKANSSHTHTLDDVSETTTKKIMTATERTKLSGIAEGANKYTHPASHDVSMITGLSTVATSGKYSDLSGKPTTMTPTAHTHEQADITGLETALAGKAASTHTHSAVTTSANGMMTAADKTKLNGIATGANKTVVDSALSSTSTNPVQNKVINSALSGKANSSHTHAQSAITGLTDALAGKAAANHNHDTRYISKSLQLTADDGDVSVNWTGQNVVSKFLALPCGMCTAYSAKGTTGNPNDDESFRFICHKTGTNLFGWVMAHGAKGSVYSGYVDNGTWRGWKCIYESTNSPLWSGAYYMNASQTVTPSKPLSKCRNGWILVWSDYDPSTSKPTGADHFTVAVPKLNGGGATWSGQSMTLAIPSALSDSGVLTMAGKKIYIHDAKITGHAVNKIAPANDVVLRAVYEY